ncbi:MAG: hypothetical protein RIC14_05680 [Filomicrobium sp.]
MRGEKTIDLGFTIQVSQGGQYVDANSVTVRAPGFRRADIHDQMTVWVGKAAMSFEKFRADIPQTKTVTDDEDIEDIESKDEDWMTMVSMGLDVDQFTSFASYVRSVLTNSKLANVGDGDARLTDEAWEAIFEQGGMDAVRRIESAFVGFFFAALVSKRKVGKGKSRSSAKPTRARSNSKRPETTPG